MHARRREGQRPRCPLWLELRLECRSRDAPGTLGLRHTVTIHARGPRGRGPCQTGRINLPGAVPLAMVLGPAPVCDKSEVRILEKRRRALFYLATHDLLTIVSPFFLI